MMMKLAGKVAIFTVAIAAVAVAAAGLSVRKTTKIKLADADAWSKFGAFCAIKDWHPAVANCEETTEGDAKFRTLTLKDGGKIKEKLTGSSPTGYTYAIIESPLPVKDYFASFSANADADEAGTTIMVWSSTFMAKDKPDSEARALIESIFQDGLASIAEKAGK